VNFFAAKKIRLIMRAGSRENNLFWGSLNVRRLNGNDHIIVQIPFAFLFFRLEIGGYSFKNIHNQDPF
jgi:hypothetical protein